MKAESDLVLYHGTTRDFESLRLSIRKGEQLGFGAHLSESLDFAERYAFDPLVCRKGSHPRVLIFKASFGSFLNADAIVKEGTPEFGLAKKLSRGKIPTVKDEDGLACLYMQNCIDASSPERALKVLADAGFQAIRYKSKIKSNLGGGYYTNEGESISWCVMDLSCLEQVGMSKEITASSLIKSPCRRGPSVSSLG